MDRALNDLVKGKDTSKPTMREPGEIEVLMKRTPGLIKEGIQAGANPVMGLFMMSVTHVLLGWVLGKVPTEHVESLMKAEKPSRG